MRKDEGERTRDATSLVSALDILLGYQKAAASIKRLCKSHRSVDSEIVNDLAIEATPRGIREADGAVGLGTFVLHPSAFILLAMSERGQCGQAIGC
jgi:hypothetical protein